MREIDFLPEWYTEGKRRRVQRCRQYAGLTIVFLGMMAHNLVSAHRIGRASAELAQLETHRVQAESVTRRFDMISAELGQYQAEANLLKQMDSRIDPAAVVAEISHLISRHVVLSRVEFISEPVRPRNATDKSSGSAVRAASRSGKAGKSTPLGDVKFHVVLAGVAASPADVGALVCRLDESSYFQEVHPSFSRNNSIEVAEASATSPKRTFQVSEFEISCYLANYKEVQSE